MKHGSWIGGWVLAAMVAAGLPSFARTWTSLKGSTIEAEFESVSDGVAYLVIPSGEKRRIPVDQLSEADRDYLLQRLSQPEPAPKPALTNAPPAATTSGVSHASTSPARAAPVMPANVERLTCQADAAVSYFVCKPDGLDESRKWPVMYVFCGETNHLQILNYLAPAQAMTRWIVAVSAGYHGKMGIEPASVLLKKIRNDVRGRFKVDTSREMIMGTGGGAHAALNFATDPRVESFAAVLLVQGGSPDDIQRAINPNTLVYGLCPASSTRRQAMIKAVNASRNPASKLQFVATSSYGIRPYQLKDAFAWINANLLKMAADPVTMGDRRHLLEKLMAFADEDLASNRVERVYETMETAQMVPAGALQSEVSRRWQAVNKDPKTEQFKEARKELDRIVQKYVAAGVTTSYDDYSLSRDIDRFKEKFPSTGLRYVLERLTVRPVNVGDVFEASNITYGSY